MSDPMSLSVRVLFLREGHAWTAQGLDYDVAAQGATIQEACRGFEQAFVGQIVLDLDQGRVPLEGIPPAPRNYWDHFNEGARLCESPALRIPATRVPPAYMISALTQEARVY